MLLGRILYQQCPIRLDMAANSPPWLTAAAAAQALRLELGGGGAEKAASQEPGLLSLRFAVPELLGLRRYAWADIPE